MNVSRLLVLSVCCLCHLIWGSITTPTYYVNAFKVQYNYTQSQVELILPMLSFGKVLSPIPAVVYQTWGFGLTLLSGLTLSSGGYLCLWGSGFFLEICYTYPILVYTCFLFLGLGSAFLNLSVLTAITINFPGKHQGKAVSTVMTSYAVSPLMTLFVYRKWFAHGEIENDAGQDLHGFMLYSAVSVAMMAALFLGVSRLINRPEPPETPLLNDCDSEDTTKPRDRKRFISDALVETIPWTFYIVVTSFSLAACLCVMSILPTAELIMYMLSITTDLAGGVVKPVLVTVLAQNMGKENFAKAWHLYL
ncbi:uncharacterized protein LOC135465417 [Liolophura sinensis]|uniref:uncharacterized protein LOC135465417 n=1 Tax=Liolophura sinensis TaxID=3198878 RepID=UPI0031582B4A